MQTDVTGNSNMFLRLHVKCPIFLSDVNQVPIFITYIEKISLKYIQRKSC